MNDQQMHTRTFSLREVSPESREFEGIAVPWDTRVEISDWEGRYLESFARGAVVDSENALVFYGHETPVGLLTLTRDDDAGWFVRGKFSQTSAAEEAYQLAKDGVLRELSVRFKTIDKRLEDVDGMPHIIRTKVNVREVSLVPFGAYGSNAPVSQVRERPTQPKEDLPMETITKADLDEVRSIAQDAERLAALAAAQTRNDEPPIDTRSAGEVLKALVAGDADTVRSYEDLLKRAYDGSTTADTVTKDAWVGDLTRLFDASTGVLANFFSTGRLPDSGMNIEFAELGSNTIAVAEQAAEGDDLGIGKVTITTRNAPVKTYGGATRLTRQEIERSSVNVLNTSLEGLTVAAAARKKAVLRTAFDALYTARSAIASNGGVVVLGAVLGSATAGHWEDALIDAAIKFEAENLTLDGMLVSASVFKKLRSLTVSGERVFQTAKDNSSGTLNLPGLEGEFASLTVKLDTGASGDKASFANKRAIRQYDTALVSLQDENILNLSKAFAVYRYGAVAAEIPAGLVPVKLASS